MSRELSIAELAAQAAETEDQTLVQESGNFEQELIEAGVTVGRFVSYVEIGKQPRKPYLGKAKTPVDKVRITFELLHPKKNIKEYEVEGEKRVRGQSITLTISKSLSDKGAFKDVFNKMTYGRPIKHMAQMLGEAFILTIYHNKTKDASGVEKTYANLNVNGGEYGIGAPFVFDPITEERKDVPVREPITPLRLFLFTNPTKPTWDSLYIDGTRKQKDAEGVEVEVSNNWLQEQIMSALNFKGSALDIMLSGVDGLSLEETGTVDESGLGTMQEAQADKPTEKAAGSDAAPAGTSTPESKANDALAALGLG